MYEYQVTVRHRREDQGRILEVQAGIIIWAVDAYCAGVIADALLGDRGSVVRVELSPAMQARGVRP